MQLREVKTKHEHYFVDEQNHIRGEYKCYHKNGQLKEHCYLVNGRAQGEYKLYHENGHLAYHYFYENDKDITDQVEALVKDINNISNEEKFLIKMTFGIPFITT